MHNAELMSSPIVTLDVRNDLKAGREPFPRIMEAVGRLREGERLQVIAPFEPRPLIGVLTAQGFSNTVTATDDGGVAVLFTPAASTEDDGDSLL
jgi:uncharacterized protein (DUF2249 family)